MFDIDYDPKKKRFNIFSPNFLKHFVPNWIVNGETNNKLNQDRRVSSCPLLSVLIKLLCPSVCMLCFSVHSVTDCCLMALHPKWVKSSCTEKQEMVWMITHDTTKMCKCTFVMLWHEKCLFKRKLAQLNSVVCHRDVSSWTWIYGAGRVRWLCCFSAGMSTCYQARLG